MYLEVYVDVIFIINFVMDYILLYIVKKIIKREVSYARLALGSLVGAICACILTLIPKLNQVIQFIISYLIVCIFMVWVTFRPKSIRSWVKCVVNTYLITFLIGGLFNSLYYHSMLGYYFHEIINGRFFSRLNGLKLFILTLIAFVLIFITKKVIKTFLKEDEIIYETKIYFRDKSISLTGLLDTGNNLYDPIFGKPVNIIEYSALKNLLSESQIQYIDKWLTDSKGNSLKEIEKNETINVYMIPYSSIGKKKGLLTTIEIDKVEIIKGNDKICNKNVLAGIWNGKFNKCDKYQFILHKDLM